MKKNTVQKSVKEQNQKRLSPDLARVRKVMAHIKTGEKHLEKVYAILSYEDQRGGFGFFDFGIGYRAGTNKLVEFNFPREGQLPQVYDSFKINAITLIDSLKWVETMLGVEERLDIIIQNGPRLADWLGELRVALEEHPRNGKSRLN